VGQCELDDLLNSQQLWQFKQRIARRMTIRPLSAEEVGPYIQYRWTMAGGKDAPFSAEAVAGIAQVTQGIPRLINVTCDNTLIDAFGEESAIVEARHLMVVCRDLHLSMPIPPMPIPQLTAPSPQRAAPPQSIATVAAMDADPMDSNPMKTLERYSAAAAPRLSLLGRLRNKLKLTQRIETA
jgi:hypothetical protein